MTKRILLCDDEIHILRAAEFKLKKAGYDPECAGKVEPWIKEAEENADKRDFMKGR